jgi:hypothetical protein
LLLAVARAIVAAAVRVDCCITEQKPLKLQMEPHLLYLLELHTQLLWALAELPHKVQILYLAVV